MNSRMQELAAIEALADFQRLVKFAALRTRFHIFV